MENSKLTAEQIAYREKFLTCKRCGSNFVLTREDYRICKKCGLKVLIQKGEGK